MEFDVLDIVQHVLNIGVLYLILRAILYKPVRKFMLQREESYTKRREETERALKEAETLHEKNEQLLLDAQNQAQRMADEKLVYAEHVAEQTVAKARDEAALLLRDARVRIRQEEQEAQGRLVEQTAALAVDLATRILGREISLEDNERLIDEYFHKVG